MGLYDTFINILSQQIVNILIALGVGLFFFVLTPWGLKKYLKTAEVERRNRAKENILDLLESSMIFKQDVNPKKILHLISAVGREYTVDVFSYLTIKNLLEEVELRFEKSKHLDPGQKQEYTRKIETLISDLEKQDENLEIPITYNNLLEELTKNVNNNDKESTLKNIDVLKSKLIRKSYDSSDSIIIRSIFMNSRSRSLIYILMIIMYLYIIIKLVILK